jgi:protein PhnA
MIQDKLQERSNKQCELCTSTNDLSVYTVPPRDTESEENSILICENCNTQINDESKVDPNHWRCLNDSMWSEVPAVKVVAWRMLNQLRAEGWPADLLSMMYLEDETLAWAKEGTSTEEIEEEIVHKDSNGVVLASGDTVVLIKDLPVKGSSLVAKRGTAVRRISLDHDNANHIEGRVDGQQVVILTQFVKKS